jgi:hypothetical protein
MRNSKLILKDHKKEDFRALFNEIDPIGIFFEEFENFDEYDPEIKDLIVFLNKNINLPSDEVLKNELKDIFTKKFTQQIESHVTASKYSKLIEGIIRIIRT